MLVVATDEKAMAKLERQLATAGLLIRGRIELGMRDKNPNTQANQDFETE